MLKFIAILTGCSLTLAVSVRAEQGDPKKNPVQKSKSVQKQQFSPKQHQGPNTHVQTLHAQHTNNPVPNNVRNKVHSDVSKNEFHTVPRFNPITCPRFRRTK